MILLYFAFLGWAGWGISLCLCPRKGGGSGWRSQVWPLVEARGFIKAYGGGRIIVCACANTIVRRLSEHTQEPKTPEVNPHTMCSKMKYSNPNFLSANNCLFNSSCFSSFSTRITFRARCTRFSRPKTDYLHCLFAGFNHPALYLG